MLVLAFSLKHYMQAAASCLVNRQTMIQCTIDVHTPAIKALVVTNKSRMMEFDCIYTLVLNASPMHMR